MCSTNAKIPEKILEKKYKNLRFPLTVKHLKKYSKKDKHLRVPPVPGVFRAQGLGVHVGAVARSFVPSRNHRNIHPHLRKQME